MNIHCLWKLFIQWQRTTDCKKGLNNSFWKALARRRIKWDSPKDDVVTNRSIPKTMTDPTLLSILLQAISCGSNPAPKALWGLKRCRSFLPSVSWAALCLPTLAKSVCSTNITVTLPTATSPAGMMVLVNRLYFPNARFQFNVLPLNTLSRAKLD